MAGKKECIHCRRSIDAGARLCPYCNRDQDALRAEQRATPPLPPIEAAPVIKPPRRFARDRWSTKALLIAAVVVLLMASFGIGGLVYGLGKRGDTSVGGDDRRPRTEGPQPADSDLPHLTLVSEADPTATMGRSITTAPIPDPDHQMPAEFQRSDATALPSSEYARLMEQSRKAATPPPQPPSVDPRTVKTPLPGVEAPPPQRPEPAEEESSERRREPENEPAERSRRESEAEPVRIPEMTPRRERVTRTNPVPVYQPLPRIKDREEEIQESGTMRFRLTVDRDGGVKEIRVIETMPGMTGKMISAMQRWKFKPATENGVPVEGTFMVDISFNAPP